MAVSRSEVALPDVIPFVNGVEGAMGGVGKAEEFWGNWRVWQFWSQAMLGFIDIAGYGQDMADETRKCLEKQICEEVKRGSKIVGIVELVGRWRAADLICREGMNRALAIYTKHGGRLVPGFQRVILLGRGLVVHEANGSANLECPEMKAVCPLGGWAVVEAFGVRNVLVSMITQVHDEVTQRLLRHGYVPVPREWYEDLVSFGEKLNAGRFGKEMLKPEHPNLEANFLEVSGDVPSWGEWGLGDLERVARQAAGGVRWLGSRLEALWIYPEVLARRDDVLRAGMGIFIRWDPVSEQQPGGNGIGRPSRYREALSGSGWKNGKGKHRG